VARHASGDPEARAGGIYIQQAASLVGATPVQLRMWEQQSLITPARTTAGYRTYSMTDIERMRRIQSLIAAGVNAAGVRRILDGAGAVPHNGKAAEVTPPRSVGQTIRDLRRHRGMSLRDAAEATGLSPSYISSLERDAAAPSIASLQKLGAAYETNAITLMSGSYEAPDSPVVRADERRVLDNPDRGVKIEDLSTANSNLEPLIFTFQPGCGSDGAISHEGEEFLLVMTGRLHLCLDGSDEYLLDPGDSMSYRSERAHQFGNPGDIPSTVLWINTPRTF
jgi:DNA-binding transcriptional MerR regulator/quercetin dioxygenase-like cupin family protein